MAFWVPVRNRWVAIDLFQRVAEPPLVKVDVVIDDDVRRAIEQTPAPPVLDPGFPWELYGVAEPSRIAIGSGFDPTRWREARRRLIQLPSVADAYALDVTGLTSPLVQLDIGPLSKRLEGLIDSTQALDIVVVERIAAPLWGLSEDVGGT